MAARRDLELSGDAALAVVVDVEKLRESAPVPDVARLAARRLRRVVGSGPAAGFAAAELRGPGMRGMGCWGSCGGGGGGVEAGEAFAEARGAEAGDGSGGVAVTDGAAVGLGLGLAVVGHGWWWWL